MKNLCSCTQCGGFQFLLSLDLWGIRFHAVVVFGLGKNLLFKSVLGRCVSRQLFFFGGLRCARQVFSWFLEVYMGIQNNNNWVLKPNTANEIQLWSKYIQKLFIFCHFCNLFVKGVIQQLRGPNFSQLRPPPPSSGHFTYYIFFHMTKRGLTP